VTDPVQTRPSPADVVSAVDAVAAIATDLGRDDFAHRLVVAAARVKRPATIICIVGEFKQGKSSLVNAMLGQSVCPVDDDIATSAITLLHYGAERTVEVRRRVDEGVVVEQVDSATLAEWVSEHGNPDNVKGVERVDISLPHPLLADGLVIVDTPGMGGLGAGHAASTLAFLPFADGLVFVTDASAELSEPEAEFLDRAAELCPNIAFVLSKTDLYPAWRQIERIDASRRAELDGAKPILPVSAALFGTDVEPGDQTLVDASGIPALLAALDAWVVAPAKDLAADRAVGESIGVLDQLEHQLQTELDVLVDPSHLADVLARISMATSHLERLRGPGSRWSVLVADRVSDLSNNSGFQFRKAMRSVSRDMEDSIELLKSPEDWEQLARRLQTDVADAVTDVFVGIERGAQSTREAVAELIGEEAVDTSPWSSRREIELSSMWADKGIDPTARKATQQLGSALVGLRGAQSGIVLFGMMGRLLPAGAAALMMSNPVTVGIGAAFAGMQLADAHKRKIALRRQQARSNVRQFLDEVQFAVGNEISDVMREVQRGIRDEFTDRISELMRTYTETAQQAQQASQRASDVTRERIVVVRSALDRIARVRTLLPQAGS
jgi:hypothetical protein